MNYYIDTPKFLGTTTRKLFLGNEIGFSCEGGVPGRLGTFSTVSMTSVRLPCVNRAAVSWFLPRFRRHHQAVTGKLRQGSPRLLPEARNGKNGTPCVPLPIVWVWVSGAVPGGGRAA